MAETKVHLHWGDGIVAEEVRLTTSYHVAVAQLIVMEDHSELLRFCWYDHTGRFHRSPLIVDPKTWTDLLRVAKAQAPRLYERLRGEDEAAGEQA